MLKIKDVYNNNVKKYHIIIIKMKNNQYIVINISYKI